MKRKFFVMGMIFVLGLVYGPVSGYTADKIVIKASTVQMPHQTIGTALMMLKAAVEKRLGDRVDFKAYPSAQLYKQTEEIQALSRGDIQMAAVIGTGSLPKISPVFQVIELPGLFPSKKVFHEVMDGPTGRELWAVAEKKNIKSVSFYQTGRTCLTNKKGIEIKVPADVKGLKIRAAGKTYSELLKSWGAMVVSIPSEEQYNALQQGVMDGIMTAVTVVRDRRLYEHLTNLTSLDFLTTRPTNILANNKWWDSLPADIRAAIQSAADEVTHSRENDMNQEDEEAFKAIAASGVKVYRMSDQQFKVWRVSGKKVWPALSKKIGQEWVDKMVKAVDQAELGQ